MVRKHGVYGIHVISLDNRIASNECCWSGTSSFCHVHFVSSRCSHINHGLLVGIKPSDPWLHPFCMSSGLAFCICCSAETGDRYKSKNFFIVRGSPLILFLVLVPTNSNNDTSDCKYSPGCTISFASSPFALGKTELIYSVQTHCNWGVNEGSMQHDDKETVSRQ
jgi:hypothetical protein